MSDSKFIVCRRQNDDSEWNSSILRGSEPYDGMISTKRLFGEIEEFCYPNDLEYVLENFKKL